VDNDYLAIFKARCFSTKMPRPLYEYLDSQSNVTEVEVEGEDEETSEVAVTTANSNSTR
jgi:hypothetical protein